MTKKEKKSKGKQVEKEEKQNEQSKEEKKKRWNIANVISVASLFITTFLTCFTLNYLDKEYKYKLSPEVEIYSGIKLQLYQLENNVEKDVYSERIKIKIKNKNNLEKAYLIYPNNVVRKLNIDEVENTLVESFDKDIELKKDELKFGDNSYQYCFLLLMGMDGSYELCLIYVKTDGENIKIDSVSGIEIWGLENSNKDDPEFEGERVMAEQYRKILKESSNYIK